MSREYALFCFGRFVSAARGEQDYFEESPMTFATAAEGAKSNALVRCCKDLGIASELWDPQFIRAWKDKYAMQVQVQKDGQGKKILWRRFDRPAFGYPYKEVAVISEATILSEQARTSKKK